MEAAKTVKSGDQFAVKVKSNPTTGFSWDVQSSNDSLVKLVKNEFHKSGNIIIIFYISLSYHRMHSIVVLPIQPPLLMFITDIYYH